MTETKRLPAAELQAIASTIGDGWSLTAIEAGSLLAHAAAVEVENAGLRAALEPFMGQHEPEGGRDKYMAIIDGEDIARARAALAIPSPYAANVRALVDAVERLRDEWPTHSTNAAGEAMDAVVAAAAKVRR